MSRKMDEDMEILDDTGESLNLDSRLTSIPLDALRRSSRSKIALYLDDQSDIIDEECGYVTDWNGLAELIGFTALEMRKFGRQKSPTQDLLVDWEITPALNPTLGNLWKYLIELGRLDVLQDCRSFVIKDAENYILTKERLANDYLPVQENQVSQSSAPDHYVDETRMLVTGDIDGSITLFDAFVCYNADSTGKDIVFVKDMIKKLEKEYDLKLCVPGRDDLPGGSRYVTDAKLIESRCKRMIIVLSHEYLHSSACDFQVKFAHALAPGARSKKLIPVLIEPSVPIPQILRHVTLCDYTKNDLMEWFWDRLAKSVKAPLDPEPNRMGSSVESSSPMSIPSNSSSSLQSQTSLSPSQSLSSIENYRLTNDSIKNAQRQLSESASMSSNTSSDSGFHSSSFQSQGASSLQSNQSSFSNEYTSLSTESFPTSSSKAREKKKGTNIFGQIKAKVSGKKHNNNTSSQA
ncbi:MYD88 [Mytilus edulis]|uniref:MYD88 n=1 Tax=Mytilus edulis TaxID=6550 RepID=A0A8S3UZD5_MYTED|nr:MYD88 [Mytilus edulis]